MKRIGTYLLLFGLVAVGCMPVRMDESDVKKLPTPPRTQIKGQTPPVMVEDVNESNPEEAARRLEAELKGESQKN